jgi:exopolyphosphatase / guanosine-5'-triphosphate,3'-diphosphate pyrophosphatase
MSNRVAVIDFGTNTARLLIADRVDKRDFRHVHLRREIVRMGGGFSKSEGLSPEAMERGLSCLARFSEHIREYDVVSVRAVATSAVRDACNGAVFVEDVRRETGIELVVIDGIAEGNLTLAGVMAGLDRSHDEILVVDIGGGSTEYTLARSGRADFVRSLPLGVVRLTEGQGSVAAMESKIQRELEALRRDMAESRCRIRNGTPLVGTAGTATTLAAISMEMEEYDYRKVNNTVISRDEIAAIFGRLLPLTPQKRLEVPGLERGREDLIISGMLITLRTMELFGMGEMKVSDYGLLEGLLVSLDGGIGRYGE